MAPIKELYAANWFRAVSGEDDVLILASAVVIEMACHKEEE